MASQGDLSPRVATCSCCPVKWGSREHPRLCWEKGEARRGGHTTPCLRLGGRGEEKTPVVAWGLPRWSGGSASAELEQVAVGTGLCSHAFPSKASW